MLHIKKFWNKRKYITQGYTVEETLLKRVYRILYSCNFLKIQFLIVITSGIYEVCLVFGLVSLLRV